MNTVHGYTMLLGSIISFENSGSPVENESLKMYVNVEENITLLWKWSRFVQYVYLEIFIHRDGFCFSRDGGEGETIRVKWPKFSQQISLTKIQSRLVAIEGCIVGPWKMAVGNNRIMLLALRCRDEMGKRRRKRENKRRERHSRI